ncbi:MAG: capsule assembly Wzi family protein [Emcibacteraceae bacterium]
MKNNVAIFFVGLIALNSTAMAQQWAAPNDASLRRDIELLKSYDIISGPLNSWPISWKQITENINIVEGSSFPAHVMSAIERVKRKIPNKGFRGSIVARYTNEPDLVRGFGDTPISDADFSVSAGFTEEKIEANVTVNYRDNVSNHHVNFDNSYIATHLGNWSLYAGAIDRWWGPGQENTLLLSSNARPMMSVGLRRNNPKAFKTKWLSWMGPWTWDMFVANMGDDRVIPDALMAGMRLGFEPIKNFEVGLSRTMQLCGLDRPCGFSTWTKALIAVGDLDNTGTRNEPGNQLASIDLSYSTNFGDKSLKIYAEGTAEDQNVILPFQYSRLVGGTLTMPIGENGDSLSINAELSDSGDVQAWFFGKRYPGTMYNHSIYGTGHRYDGRSLGHSLDTDSRLASLMISYSRAEGDMYSIILRTGSLNWDNTTRSQLSFGRQKYSDFELKASKKIGIGIIEANLNIQSEIFTLTQGVLPNVTGGIIWRVNL